MEVSPLAPAMFTRMADIRFTRQAIKTKQNTLNNAIVAKAQLELTMTIYRHFGSYENLLESVESDIISEERFHSLLDLFQSIPSVRVELDTLKHLIPALEEDLEQTQKAYAALKLNKLLWDELRNRCGDNGTVYLAAESEFGFNSESRVIVYPSREPLRTFFFYAPDAYSYSTYLEDESPEISMPQPHEVQIKRFVDNTGQNWFFGYHEGQNTFVMIRRME